MTPVEISVKERERGRVRYESDRTTSRPPLADDDGGLHAGVRHDGGTVQEEFESKKGEKLGGREQLEGRRGRIHLYSGSMSG